MKNVYETKYAKLKHDETNDYYIYEVPDMICVLPVLPNGDVLLVEQDRIPTGKRLIELVCGRLKPNEDPEAAARREIKEEIGYACNELRLINSFYTSPAFLTQKAYLFIANLEDVYAGTELEEQEQTFGLTAQRYSVEEALHIAKTNETHAFLLPALLMLQEK